MNTDLTALHTAVEHGKTTWLRNRHTEEVARLRAVDEEYELVRQAGTPVPMAHLAADGVAVPAHHYPDPARKVEKELHTLLEQVATEYQDWTEDRAELDEDVPHHWAIDEPGW